MTLAFFIVILFAAGVILFGIALVTIFNNSDFSYNDIQANKDGIAHTLIFTSTLFLISIGFMVIGIGLKVLWG